MEGPVNFHVGITVMLSQNCQCASYGGGSFPAILADHHDNIEIVLEYSLTKSGVETVAETGISATTPFLIMQGTFQQLEPVLAPTLLSTMLEGPAESGIMIGGLRGRSYCIPSLVENKCQGQGSKNLLCSFDCMPIFNV